MKDPETDWPRAGGVWLVLKAYARSESAGMSAVTCVKGYFPAQQFMAQDFAAQAVAQGRTFADADDWRPMTIEEIKAWEAEDRQLQADIERDRRDDDDDDD